MSTTYGNRPLRIRFSSNDSDGIAEFFDGSESGATAIQLPKFNTTERDAYSASAGEIIYNESTNVIQIYNGSSWANVDTDTTLTLVDEDNMASNSATKLATQQSIKAYVDSQSSATEGFNIASGNVVSGVNERFGTPTNSNSISRYSF